MPKKKPPLLLVKTEEKDDDEEKNLLQDEDDDSLENSCDIGETTLRKGPLAINQSGIKIVQQQQEKKYLHTEEKQKETFKRKTIGLEDLEMCGLLGRGCSGHVMKAKHKSTEKFYAVKVVNNVYDKSKRNQMLTEIRTLYHVESPWLVDFYGAYFKDHALSIVLEYCEVGSLDTIIHKYGPVPERVIAAMAYQILHGLLYLKQNHHHFHRDIKPQNILVKSTGQIKLTDFGIARKLNHSLEMAQTFIGTFKYMSPERIKNEPYDYKSDIWSLGLVLLECATQKFPYENVHSHIDIVQSILETPAPTLPFHFANEFTIEFQQFLETCLQKNPSDRLSVESLLGSEWFCLYGFVNEEKQNKTNEICREWLGFDVMDPKNSSYKQQQQEEEEEEEEEEKKKNIKQEEEQEVYYQDDFEEETNINL